MNNEEQLINIIDAKLRTDDIQINDLNIHYVVGGEGPPLIFLHGANIGWGAWYPNIAFFAKYFTVYALDFPGSGMSTKITFRETDFEKTFIDTIEQFIKIKNLKTPVIVGHSLGAWVGVKIGLKDIGISKIVVESPLGFTKNIPINFQPLAFYPFAKLLTKTAVKPTKKNMEKFLKDVMSKESLLDEKFVEYFHNMVEKNQDSHPFFLLNKLFGFLKIKKEFMLTDDLKKLNCPVLIIAGDEDPLIPLHQIKKTVPMFKKALLSVFKGTGHVPSLEKSDQFNNEVLQFLSL